MRITLPSRHDPSTLRLFDWLTTETGRLAALAPLRQEQRGVAQQTIGRGPFVPLAFGTSEAFQFNWSED